jgi:hypothetical protein
MQYAAWLTARWCECEVAFQLGGQLTANQRRTNVQFQLVLRLAFVDDITPTLYVQQHHLACSFHRLRVRLGPKRAMAEMHSTYNTDTMLGRGRGRPREAMPNKNKKYTPCPHSARGGGELDDIHAHTVLGRIANLPSLCAIGRVAPTVELDLLARRAEGQERCSQKAELPETSVVNTRSKDSRGCGPSPPSKFSAI